MGNWSGAVWEWNIRSASEVLGLEATREHEELEILMHDIRLVENVNDQVVWPYDKYKKYSVASAYDLMLKARVDEASNVVLGAGNQLCWGAIVPSKLKIFGWRVLQDRLPTKKQLFSRGIITQIQDTLCIVCQQEVEDITHLLFQCGNLQNVWRRIYIWLEINLVPIGDCCNNFLSFVTGLAGMMSPRRAAAIWLTCCWCIWMQRNDIIFNDAEFDSEELFFRILWQSWWWLALEAKDRIACNFYEWFQNPHLCA
ncbi:uncharacterized protein LOC131595241 [Vicia villosa]|uniref:uncharacterized protein LOC131595241 n=1 Tax=Vicia villosa TaxID=3911 RepID=UPI00273C8BA8|nr:uncharacterized protein LOC131595241 [Vicia villosa]